MSSTKLTITYFILVIIIVPVITVMNLHLKTKLIPNEHIVKINFTRSAEANLKYMFDLTADIERYPEVIPDNYSTVKIINRTENFIQAKEHIFEREN